jgi:HrpA-like RNA helicase
MSLPSLYIKGKLKETGYGDKQATLNEIIPIDYIMKWFADKMDSSSGPEDRILIVKASTGSGKSTTLPPEFYYRYFKRTERRSICCTQPRVLTAKEIPADIVKYSKPGPGSEVTEPLVLGKTIGYQTRRFRKKPQKGLVYMQINVLPSQMNVMTTDEFINKYSAIFLDEVHVRQIGIDLTMFKMKKFIHENYKNKKCPFLVLMSATFDAFKFADYFLDGVPEKTRYKNIIFVEGLSFPIEEHFLSTDTQNYVYDILETVKKIHIEGLADFNPNSKKELVLKEDLAKKTAFRDVCIFVPGAALIDRLKSAILELNDKDKFFIDNPVMPIGVTSSVVSEAGKDYNNIFRPFDELSLEIFNKKTKGIELKKPVRRIFIATNVAETGITINSLKYVIDLGFYNSMEFNPCFGVNILALKPVTQGMYKQRRGRVGRKSPGICYAMFTKESFDAMQEDEDPDILRVDTSHDMLDIIIKQADKDIKIGKSTIKQLIDEKFVENLNAEIDLLSMDLIDKPSADSLHFITDKLFTLGAVDPNLLPTWTGLIMNKFRLMSMESIRTLLSGYPWKVSISDLITIISFQETKYTDLFTKKICEKFGDSQLLFADDFVSSLVIWNDFVQNLEWKTLNSLNDWCNKYDISPQIMIDVSEKRDDIMKTLTLVGLNPFENFEKSLKFLPLNDHEELIEYAKNIKQCIFEGYKMNIASMGVLEYSMLISHIQFNFKRPWINKVKYVMTDNILYKKSGDRFEAAPNFISVLDGFLPIDTLYDIVD